MGSKARLWSAAALACMLLYAPYAPAASAAPQKFDLICHGKLEDRLLKKVIEFKAAFSVDVRKKQICDEQSCETLTKTDARSLVSDCDAHDGGRFCDAERIDSTAGPFVQGDQIVVDLVTGKFSRKMWGELGDRAPRPFHDEYAGVCRIAPFKPHKPTLFEHDASPPSSR